MIFQNLSHCARTCSCTTWQVTDQKSPVGQVVRETRANWEKATADLPKVNTVLTKSFSSLVYLQGPFRLFVMQARNLHVLMRLGERLPPQENAVS